MKVAAVHRVLLRGVAAAAIWAMPSVSAKLQIDVPVVTQEQTEWCWVGVSTSVLRYYNQSVTQCQIANYARTTATWHDFGQDDCCTKGGGACNWWNYNYGYSGSIQEILKKWGVGNIGQAGTLTLDQIGKQLEAKRPFVIRWGYVAGGGHFIVGHGVSDSSIHYMDPWPGEGSKIAKYSWIVSNKDKKWDGTNVLTTNPTASVLHAATSGSRGFVARMTENGLTVFYSLGMASSVRIDIRSLQGKVLNTFDLPSRAAGTHSHVLPGFALPPGGYVVGLRTGESIATAMVIVER